MGNLSIILNEYKFKLAKPSEKLLNQLLRKLSSDSYYPDAKNIQKLQEISSPDIDEYLIDCLECYQQTAEMFHTDSHDIVALRAVWAVLGFSEQHSVKQWLDRFISQNIADQPVYLSILYDMLKLANAQHPAVLRIQQYYAEIMPQLVGYQILQKLQITPPDLLDWSISLVLTTDGKWSTPAELSEDERQKRFTFELALSSPQVMNDTYEVNLENASSSQKRRMKVKDSHIFSIDFDQQTFPKLDLLNLKKFIEDIGAQYGISFNFEQIAYLSVSKGIPRKKIEQWIQNRFEF